MKHLFHASCASLILLSCQKELPALDEPLPTYDSTKQSTIIIQLQLAGKTVDSVRINFANYYSNGIGILDTLNTAQENDIAVVEAGRLLRVDCRKGPDVGKADTLQIKTLRCSGIAYRIVIIPFNVPQNAKGHLVDKVGEVSMPIKKSEPTEYNYYASSYEDRFMIVAKNE